LTSKQTLDAQRALVAGLEAQIKGDQATIDNARTQLAYTTITAPIEGRTGIRLVDPGNNVHATDTTGIVVLTQVHPISFIFTLPEDELPAVSRALAAGPVAVTALSRDDKTELDHGTLALIDNQIDQATGSARLKAVFQNDAGQLWPGEFLNARLLVDTARNAMTIPSAAVQRGPSGVFTFPMLPIAPLPQVDFPTIQVSATLAGGQRRDHGRQRDDPARAAILADRRGDRADLDEFAQLELDHRAIQPRSRHRCAAGDILSAINAASGQLPTNLPSAPSYRKVNPADSPILILALTSASLPLTVVDDSAENILSQQLSQISGVAQITSTASRSPRCASSSIRQRSPRSA
jgi:hypothetical protein